MESPVKFKSKKLIAPFKGSDYIFKKQWDANLGNDLQLYNLLILDINIKSPVATVGGVKFRVSGRQDKTDSTLDLAPDGWMNGEKVNDTYVFNQVGRYKISFDISTLREGWIWIMANKYTNDLKVSDVVDVRISIQNSNNILKFKDNNPSEKTVVYASSNAIGGDTYPKIDVSSLDTVNLKIRTNGIGSNGYYELYVNGTNNIGEKKGLDLIDKRTGTLLYPWSYSSYLDGNMWFIRSNYEVDVLLDVSEYDSIQLLWIAKNGAKTEIPYSLTVLQSSQTIEELSKRLDSSILYNSKSFTIEKCRDITDCLWNTFISVNADRNILSISTQGINRDFKDIPLTSDNFPNLKDESTIGSAYVFNRQAGNTQSGIYARVCLITNRGQIYHNYPERPNGSIGGDEYNFDESVIWDLPIGKTTRRHPSKNINEKRKGYRYDPTLLDYGYEMKPALNQDNGYGHGGFGATVGTGDMTRPRFYQFQEPFAVNDSDKDNQVDSPFRMLSYPCKTRKGTFIGTYQINRARVCLFSTYDGGRTFFVEHEFASGGLLNAVGYGNGINTTAVGSYPSGAFSLKKRNYIYPNDADKDPKDIFSYEADVIVTSISNEKEAIITTLTPHKLANQDVIILTKNDNTSTPFDFMTNTVSTKDGGTGMLYMVKIINATQFYLKEYIYSPDSNLTTRHIHYVQELKDFISFGTGEKYPNGWIMVLEQKHKDAYAVVNPVTMFNNAYRLNSSDKAPQRLCSFWMLDNNSENPTVYLGSDEVNITRPQLKIEGRTDLPSRSSAGIFKGKLSDMDDMSKFASVLDVGDVNIYCINFNGVLVAGFQMGHCAVSLDNGDTWELINSGSI